MFQSRKPVRFFSYGVRPCQCGRSDLRHPRRAATGASACIDFAIVGDGTRAAAARRSFMLPTEEHAATPDPIANGLGASLVRRPLRLRFEPPRWPGIWRMTGNCNWPDTGYGAVPVCEWIDDTGAQIWLPAQAVDLVISVDPRPGYFQMPLRLLSWLAGVAGHPVH